MAASGAAGPWTCELADVPAYNNLKLSVSLRGPNAAKPAAADSAPFALKPGGAATVNVRLNN